MALYGGMVGAAPSQDDCCYNEEQDDKPPKVINYVILPAKTFIEVAQVGGCSYRY